MGYTIDENEIALTRGDTLFLQVGIVRNGEAYTPVAGDVVRFALKHKEMRKDAKGYSVFVDENPLILKTIPNDTLVLRLDPADTASLKFGTYKYDIEITFAEDGSVDTFIENETFKLTPEVH